MEFINQFFRQLQNVYRKQELSQKILIIMSIISIVCIINMFPSESEGGYRVLFNNLIENDAAVISEVLEQKGIDYKLETDGTVILVPKGIVKELRLEVICHLEPYFAKLYKEINNIN